MKKLQVDKDVVTPSTPAAGRDDVNVNMLVTTTQAPKNEDPQRDCKRMEKIGKVAGGCETGPEQTANAHVTSTKSNATDGNDTDVVMTTTKVTTRTVSQTSSVPAPESVPVPVSPFTKFKQLDRQTSQHSPKSSSTSATCGASTSGCAPIFKFTDPALNARATTVKEQLLQWCQIKTKEYENVQVSNFSTSWSDGLAFCALIHHFLPDAFDYSQLTPQSRKHNFELAFSVADEKAGIAPLLDVEDMVAMKRPDWKCVFVYVQSIYRRFRNCQ